MAYSGFHYPLLTVGIGQLGLAGEAGIRAYAAERDIPLTSKKGYPKGWGTLVEDLHKAGHLTSEQAEYWKAAADFRNYLSHPQEVSVLPSGTALKYLSTLTYALLELFPDAKVSD